MDPWKGDFYRKGSLSLFKGSTAREGVLGPKVAEEVVE